MPRPITWLDLLAWQAVTGRELDEWVISQLRVFDRALIGAHARRSREITEQRNG
ncbi:MAG TPA: hypothetical protein VFD58_31640 [Blastocatellia bacterium]|nr:hypothetical protein [Blastocatellia bacterium]